LILGFTHDGHTGHATSIQLVSEEGDVFKLFVSLKTAPDEVNPVRN